MRRLAIALVVTSMAACGGPGARVADQRTEDGTITSGLPLRLQEFEEPLLETLGQREKLDAVVAPATDEFGRMRLLREWVGAQWPHSDPIPYPPWNALIVLDWVRSGKSGGFCAQFAQVYLQSLAYLGYTARYLELGNTSNPYTHFLTEVWSNQYDKWVLMDPDFNLHCERGGVPLSALEIHQARVSGQTGGVQLVLGTLRAGRLDPFQYDYFDYYYYLRFHMKANHLSDPEVPFARYEDMFEWRDAQTIPWELSTVDSPYAKEVLTARSTSDAAEAYARLNQVHTTLTGPIDGRMTVHLSHSVFDFDHYDVVVGSGGPALRLSGAVYDWRLVPGANRLEIRGVNTRGISGPPAVVTLTFLAG